MQEVVHCNPLSKTCMSITVSTCHSHQPYRLLYTVQVYNPVHCDCPPNLGQKSTCHTMAHTVHRSKCWYILAQPVLTALTHLSITSCKANVIEQGVGATGEVPGSMQLKPQRTHSPEHSIHIFQRLLCQNPNSDMRHWLINLQPRCQQTVVLPVTSTTIPVHHCVTEIDAQPESTSAHNNVISVSFVKVMGIRIPCHSIHD